MMWPLPLPQSFAAQRGSNRALGPARRLKTWEALASKLLILLGGPLSFTEIAAVLHLSPNVVDTELISIYRTVDAESPS
jgi:hypothetical protein